MPHRLLCLVDAMSTPARAVALGAASLLGLIYSSLPAGFAAITPEGVSTWIGAIAVSVTSAVGVVTTGLIIARKKFDEFNRTSLSGRLAEVSASLEKSRAGLVAALAEQAADRARHTEEVARLLKQLDAIQESFDLVVEENRKLREEVARLRQEVGSLRRGVDRAIGGSGEDIPSTDEYRTLGPEARQDPAP